MSLADSGGVLLPVENNNNGFCRHFIKKIIYSQADINYMWLLATK